MVEFLPANHAVHRINPDVRASLVRAQQAVVTRAFPDARSFCSRVLDDLRLDMPLPADLRARPATDISDLSFAELRGFWSGLAAAAGVPEEAAVLHALNLAQHSQLLRAFDEPADVLAWAQGKVTEIVADFPKTAADIERGATPETCLILSSWPGPRSSSSSATSDRLSG